jgi:Flp pilus assembly protein TadD
MTEIVIFFKDILHKRKDVLAVLFLAALILVLYAKTRHFEFIAFDDNMYVSENATVQEGMTIHGLAWAFSMDVGENLHWHPMTWISHMLDCEFFGLNPGWHHFINVFIHLLNTLILFIVLRISTKTFWPCFFVVALFGLHPINVDSVAWIAERKNVLSTFFWMLTLLLYINYCAAPRVYRYGLVAIAFMLGLMTKPMLVTMPLVLLLIDIWPLQRFSLSRDVANRRGDRQFAVKRPLALLLEKVPLIAISIVAMAIFFKAVAIDHSGDGVGLKLRMANALVSYVNYLGKAFWPADLSIHYPFPKSMFPVWQLIAAGMLLLGLSGLVLWQAKKRPYLLTGWFWYLGTLVPVLGLVRTGLWPAMADRFAYVPLIGIYVAVVWTAWEIRGDRVWRAVSLLVLASIVLGALSVATWRQTMHWRNSNTIFEQALAVTEKNDRIHLHLGGVLVEQGRLEEAIEHFSTAIAISPEDHFVHTSFGIVMSKMGKSDKAVWYLRKALDLKSGYTEAQIALAKVFADIGKINESVHYYSEALHTKPDNAEAHIGMGTIRAEQGNLTEAISHFVEAVKIEPNNATACYNLGFSLMLTGKTTAGIWYLDRAVHLEPDTFEARFNLGVALAKETRNEEAVKHIGRAIQLRPDAVDARFYMGVLTAALGDESKAIDHFEKTLELKPDHAGAHIRLGMILLRNGKPMEAKTHCGAGLRMDPSSRDAKRCMSEIHRDQVPL